MASPPVRETGRSPPRVVAWLERTDGPKAAAIAWLACLLYALCFGPLFRLLGPGTEAIAALPVLLVAARYGRRGGLAAAFAAIGWHLLLYVAWLDVPSTTSLTTGSLPANLILPLLGLVVGQQRDLKRRLDRQILERRETEARLTQAGKEAEEANRAKSDFLARMSHEIRTPMNAVLGVSRLLLETRLADEQREYVEMIRTSGNALLLIINDILDFSKVEAGMLEIDKADFDLLPVISEVMNIMAMQGATKGLPVVLHRGEGLPERVSGDAGRLRQVLINLVGNAIKFSERGEISVSVEVVGRDESRDVVRFEVRDQGIGISAEAQAAIFEPFKQADGSSTTKHGGTGLGLAISRQLVQMMGGRIGCESVLGEGSTFFFEIPMERRQPLAPEVELPGEVERLRGLRAVLLETAGLGDAFALRLSSFDMRVETLDTPDETLRRLMSADREQEPVAMCVVDVAEDAPWILQLGQRIRSDPVLGSVVLVLMAPEEAEVSAPAVEGAGYAAFLTRPIDQVTLCEGLAAALDAARQQRRGKRAEFMVTRHRMQEERTQGVARVLLAEDNRINRVIAVKLLEKLGLQVDVAANGREAVEMASANAYDAVFMDCRMPEMDGFEATEGIRAMERAEGRHTPIIALTASALASDRERCLAAGMDAHLSKPVDPDLLRKAVARWIPRRRAAVSTAIVVERAHDRSLPVDPSLLDRLRVAGGAELVSVAVDGFISAAPESLSDLKFALRTGDAGTLRFAAHRFKGACGAVGARRMAELCGRLEQLDPTADARAGGELIQSLQSEYQLVADALGSYRGTGDAGAEAGGLGSHDGLL